jgi:hypothetical protein
MRVLVCGSRTYTDTRSVWILLDGLFLDHSVGYMVAHVEPFVLIEGGAAGADRAACRWVTDSPLHGPYVVHEQYAADWERYGRRAGYLRNAEMLRVGEPELVVGFVDKPLEESRGTKMMLDLAKAAGVETWVVQR